ncbi:hypothetical protein RhiirA4_550053 [Rhizophagus irregularis]|uniref:ubiquitinyl hydrolase 1 n=1 Tax=Rhizophagus irregularis TaxID=588596 RepID=A0A2I1HHS7_9GLOM|nr:hypothetical protein RhiirA4_550053 [Rhizophagus irregularis]
MEDYLTVKIVTAEKFKVHQGFDLANFDDRQYPLSDVHVFRILKSDTFGFLKELVSRNFNIPSERVRLWVLVHRLNATVRPDAPISDFLINISMEEIHAKMTSRPNEMKLYMEVADKPINDKKWFPAVPNTNHIMIFLKYFDPDKQALEGLGQLFVQKFGKVGDITRVLCEKKNLSPDTPLKIYETWFPANHIMVFIKYFDPDKQAFEGLGHLYVQKFGNVGDITRFLREKKNFSPDTPLKIYEEVKPNMIVEMKLKSTFQQSEIQDGDIICFQKALTETEIRKHIKTGRYWNIPHFYKSLTLRIVVSFKLKFDYFCTVKVVTAEKFKNYQGFDLVDFNINCQDTLSGVYLYKIPRRGTYGVFKENISRRFNVPPEQVQFWVLVNRQNKTIRPHIPIPESFFKTSMEKICTNMNSQQNELKLYMEIADKPINGNTWFPIIKENNRNGSSIIIFLKYFDPSTQTLKGLCHLYVQKFGKVKDYINIFCEKEKLPPDTPLKIYEEIGPNEIKEMKLGSTFQQRNGNIICFQKDLTEKEHVLIQEYIKAGLIYSIPQFYETLTSSNDFLFQPKLKDWGQFDVVLNRKWTYDQVAGEVATHLNTDPLKLQFTTAHSIFGTPKSIIKRTTTQTLSEMLQTAYLSQPAHILFYEILKTKKFSGFFKIIWLGNTIKKMEFISMYLQKNATVNETIKEICKKVTLSSPNAKIRLYEVMNHKIQKEYKGIEPINEIQEFMMLYAEEISQDELNNNHTLQVYHFTKDPLNTHGTPFKFFIKNDEVFADTKIRLQLRLGMNKEEFAKIRIAIVSDVMYKKPEYLNDDDIILSEKKLTNMDYLGLDHIDETGQAKSADRTIYIRG